MKFLVTGGAGYIGSHMVKYLQNHNHEVVVLDNFSTGHRWAIDQCEIIELDLLEKFKLRKALQKRNFDVVIHFAAKSIASESSQYLEKYYKNNVVGTINLLDEMLRNDISNIVFSSSAAIFGNPESNKIKECAPKKPINPYGKSKLMIEQILEDMSNKKQINAICLRYFNAAGAHEDGDLGEAHEPETHLIPNILNSNLNNDKLTVFGNDYNTPDGTCIRDYIHVSDLVQAHMLGITMIKKNSGFFEYNLGNGNGFSVIEVIKACEKILGETINFEFGQRREGDPDYLVADSKKAINELGWEPVFNNLNKIIASAWLWHQKSSIK